MNTPTDSDKMNDENYTPYGDEWKKEVMKHRKADIVDMLRKVCMERETKGAKTPEDMQACGQMARRLCYALTAF